MEKEIVEPRTAKFANKDKYKFEHSYDRGAELEHLRKNYAPISVDSSNKKSSREEPHRCKVKSMKFSEISKTKLNEKLIRTYYEHENVLGLKDKVFELLPTFKPLQTKRKDKVQIIPLGYQCEGELEQYLEANMIKKPLTKIPEGRERQNAHLRGRKKGGENDSEKQEEEKAETAKSLKSIEAETADNL